MFKKFIPFATATSIYEIDVNFFKKSNVSFLLMDLDNTLDSYRLYKPTEKAYKLIKMIKEAGITPIIISNNKGKRVSSYANALGIKYINSAMKPFSRRIKQFLKENRINVNDVMFVGDQMVTDIRAANGANIRAVLTNKIVKEDQWTTHINRFLEKPIRRYHIKHGNLKDWRTIYG